MSRRSWRRSWLRSLVVRIEDGIRYVIWLLMLPLTLLRRMWRTLTRSVSSRAMRSPGRGLVSVLIAYLRWPFLEAIRLVRWVGHIAVTLWPTANYRYFFQGLPALVIAILVTLPLVGKGSTKNTKDYLKQADSAMERAAKIMENKQKADDALAKKEYAEAEIFFRALTEAEPNNSYYRFQLAKVASLLGDEPRALGLMQSLASHDKTGYPNAHLWLGDHLLANATNPEDFEKAVGHYLRALENKGVEAEAHGRLATIFSLRPNTLPDSVKHFNEAVRYKPQLYVELAKVHVRLGNRDQARIEAERAVTIFQRIEQEELDNHPARLHLAEAYMFLERFPEAIKILEKGRSLTTDARYPEALGRAHLMFYDNRYRAYRQNPSIDSAQYRELLKAHVLSAIRHAPRGLALQRRMVMGIKNGGVEGDVIRDVLTRLQTRPDPPSTPLLLLALDAQDRGMLQSAETYMQRALERDTEAPQQLAVLASSFVDQPPFYPTVANQLAEMGIKAWPNDPYLRRVRGYLLMRRSEWIDALNDLKAAHAAMPNDRRLNLLLAETYTRLSSPEMAQEHRQRALMAPVTVTQNNEEVSPLLISPASP